tara:strand:- start:526 stop:777 length:252 start_codon:yes stop_codon:yes gene_type:complete
MTYSIETTIGTYKVEIQTNEVYSFGTEYHSTIRKENKVVAKIMDLRQVKMGFVPSPYHNEIIGLSEMQAVTLHRVAVKMHKAA